MTDPKDSLFSNRQFSMRVMFLMVLAVAVLSGWLVDHGKLTRERSKLTQEKEQWIQRYQTLSDRFSKVENPAKLALLSKISDSIGSPISSFPELQRLATEVLAAKRVGGYWTATRNASLEGSDCEAYLVRLASAKEGQIASFIVYCCDGKIMEVKTEIPEW